MRLSSLFSFQGRVSRGPFWLFLVASFVIYGIVMAAVSMLDMFSSSVDADGVPHFAFTGSVPVAALLLVVYLALTVAGLSFSVRRSHDRDRTGWFILLFLVPLLNIWPFIELYFLAGTPGPNRFGPDPTGANLRTAEVFR